MMVTPSLMEPDWNWNWTHDMCYKCGLHIEAYVNAQRLIGKKPLVWSTGKNRYYCNACKEDSFGGVRLRAENNDD